MNQLEQCAAVAAFLNRVCRHVRARELHADIREELISHVAERMELLLEEGMPEEEAAAEAVRQMGDPDAIGRNLHQAHKPAVEWKMFVIIAAMALLAFSECLPPSNRECTRNSARGLSKIKCCLLLWAWPS